MAELIYLDSNDLRALSRYEKGFSSFFPADSSIDIELIRIEGFYQVTLNDIMNALRRFQKMNPKLYTFVDEYYGCLFGQWYDVFSPALGIDRYDGCLLPRVEKEYISLILHYLNYKIELGLAEEYLNDVIDIDDLLLSEECCRANLSLRDFEGSLYPRYVKRSFLYKLEDKAHNGKLLGMQQELFTSFVEDLADKGDETGLYFRVAGTYAYKKKLFKDDEKAESCLKKLSKEYDSAMASFILGQKAEINEDSEKAESYFREAFIQGDLQSACHLIDYYLNKKEAKQLAYDAWDLAIEHLANDYLMDCLPSIALRLSYFCKGEEALYYLMCGQKYYSEFGDNLCNKEELDERVNLLLKEVKYSPSKKLKKESIAFLKSQLDVECDNAISFFTKDKKYYLRLERPGPFLVCDSKHHFCEFFASLTFEIKGSKKPYILGGHLVDELRLRKDKLNFYYQGELVISLIASDLVLQNA